MRPQLLLPAIDALVHAQLYARLWLSRYTVSKKVEPTTRKCLQSGQGERDLLLVESVPGTQGRRQLFNRN